MRGATVRPHPPYSTCGELRGGQQQPPCSAVPLQGGEHRNGVLRDDEGREAAHSRWLPSLQDTALLPLCPATFAPLCRLPPPFFPPHTPHNNRSVLQALPLDEKRAFLQFATGCDRAPVAGLKALNLLVQVRCLGFCVLCVCVGGGEGILDGPTGMIWLIGGAAADWFLAL